VFVTGHTGFKGAWLSCVLIGAGAKVTGYALEPPTTPSLYEIAGLAREMRTVTGDVRDAALLAKSVAEARPDVVIHMAAQPIVRAGYASPAYTYEVNVMGTVNVLESVRAAESVSSFVNVTTDKVYENREWPWGYRETDTLNGYDPYSNSKSCSELVTSSYRNSFFADGRVRISTARAGNVIGGGDFAADRIIPDCVRAALAGERIKIRNPRSTRPYQHVIEPLFAYLAIARAQAGDGALAGSYNVGPDDSDEVATGTLADHFCAAWGDGLGWDDVSAGGPHEAGRLKLDCSVIKEKLDWSPRWAVKEAVDKTVSWTKVYASGGDIREVMASQISEYVGRA
jgi:CDP-glucose 4,6-dehydratase